MLAKLFKNTIIYGIAPQLHRIVSIFTLPIITQYLTKTDYGINGVIMAYIGAIGVFEMLGLRLSVVNSFYHSEKQFKWHWRQINGFLHQWVFVYCLVLAGVIYFITPKEASENVLYIILLVTVPKIIFSPVNMMGQTYFQLNEKPVPIAWRSVVFGVIGILTTLYTVAVLKLGYMGWFISSAVTTSLTGLSYIYLIYVKVQFSPILNYKKRLIKKSLKVTLPTIPHYYSSFLLDSSDRIVMDATKVPTKEIGGYNLAYSFGSYYNAFADAVGFAIGPTLRRLFKEKKEKETRKLVFIVQIFFFILSFGICLWIKEIFYLFIQNEELRTVYPLTIPIIMGYNYKPMYMGASINLFYYENTKHLWKISFIAGAINVILNFIFIPIYGVFSAAITTFIALMYMGYSGFFMSDYKKNSSLNYYPLLFLLANVLLLAIAYILAETSIIAKASITLCIIAGMLYVLLYKKQLLQFK